MALNLFIETVGLARMPKPRQRVCLEQGLKLDINKLARQGVIRPGAKCGPNQI